MSSTREVAQWLMANPAPIHLGEVDAWTARVRAELGAASVERLLELLRRGDLEAQYQAMAAARALGVEVWAEGQAPDAAWSVTLPDGSHLEIRPEQQLAG